MAVTEPPTNPHEATETSSMTGDAEHFKPTGTIFILVMFVITLILLWASVYVILLSRGVTA